MRKSKPLEVAPRETRAELLGKLGEVFRAHGYEGTSLASITDATGLGKGSLYNFFPGGKEQMAREVLAEIDGWFSQHVFAPLRDETNASSGLAQMFAAVERYFDSGRRVCLVGVFALGNERDLFANAVRGYFVAWRQALTVALRRRGASQAAATQKADDILAGIQGALVLARAYDETGVFRRTIARLREAV